MTLQSVKFARDEGWVVIKGKPANLKKGYFKII